MGNYEEILKEKQGMLDRQSKSGQNIQSFCKAEGIAYHHFFYWQKKLSTKPVVVQKKFIELEGSNKSSSSVVAELLSVNGARLIFYHLPDVLFLKSLIS
jgi:hypothetical protein